MGSVLLKDIIAAEKTARCRTEKTEEYKREIMSEIASSEKKIIEDRTREAEAEVERLKTVHSEKVRRLLASDEDKVNAKRDSLLDAERKNSSKWVKEIYKRIISDDDGS